MKTLLSILISFMTLTAYSAEYNGQNIDGETYSCSAYSYATGSWYNVSVEFDGDEATIYFDNGGYITITLEDEVIEDLGQIEAYDYERGAYWELDLS